VVFGLELDDGEGSEGVVIEPDLPVGVVRLDPVGDAEGLLVEAPEGVDRELLLTHILALVKGDEGELDEQVILELLELVAVEQQEVLLVLDRGPAVDPLDGVEVETAPGALGSAVDLAVEALDAHPRPQHRRLVHVAEEELHRVQLVAGTHGDSGDLVGEGEGGGLEGSEHAHHEVVLAIGSLFAHPLLEPRLVVEGVHVDVDHDGFGEDVELALDLVHHALLVAKNNILANYIVVMGILI